MLELLFENIKVYGRYVKTNGMDRVKYWTKVQDFILRPEQAEGLKEINKIISSSGWDIKVKIGSTLNSNINQIYEYVHGHDSTQLTQLKIYGEEQDKKTKSLDDKTWEQYHLFLQLINIPKSNPSIDLVKLMEIAYNLGQLSVCLNEKNSPFDSKTVEFFKSNNLDRLDSYVKINASQKEELENKLAITDFVANTNAFILEQMNLVQTGGNGDNEDNLNNLDPFFSEDVEELTKLNDDYRRVIYTGKNQQFVLMSIPPNDHIKMEIHKNHDQFIRVEQGEGKAIIGITTYKLKDNTALIVPAGMQHEIINTSNTKPLKLYTIYSPPEHPDKLVQKSNPDKTNYNKTTESRPELEEQVILETPTEELVSQEILKKELNKLKSNNQTGGFYFLNNNDNNNNNDDDKKIDYKKKYYQYKNQYTMLKKFISKYY